MVNKTLKILSKGKCDTDIEDVRMNITSELASLMLEQNTDNPRVLNRRNVETLKEELIKDRWIPTCQGIGFDINGLLINGQHELTACVETGVPLLNQLVSFNLPVEARNKIDLGKKRDLSDITGINKNIITTVRVPFRAIKRLAMALEDIKPYLDGELGTLATKFHQKYGNYSGLLNGGIRAALALTVIQGKITEEKAMEYFDCLITLRTKTVANDNGLGRRVVHVEKDFGAIDDAMSQLPKLMRNLINKIKSGVVPCSIAGKMEDVTTTKARNENMMIAALQAFDPANARKNNFTTTSVSAIKDILGCE